jgi:ATP-dependent Lon protease
MPDSLPFELTHDAVRLDVSADGFGFGDTSDLPPLDDIVGQPRAMEALDLGMGIRHRDYHVFAAGLSGTGKLDLLHKALAERINDGRVPDDWVYVNNFQEPDRPLAMNLPAGQGVALRKVVQQLLLTLVETLPKAFREEDFGKEKERLRQQYRQRAEAVFKELEDLAQKSGMTVRQLPDGEILFIPLKDGRPMTKEEVEQLTPEQIKELETHQEQLMQTAAKVLERQQEVQFELMTDVRDVARSFALRLVEPLVAGIARQFDSPKLHEWLGRFKDHVIDHLDRFRRNEEKPDNRLAALLEGEEASQPGPFVDYHVNVLVDNSGLTRPPVIIEAAPNYRNLFGTIERAVDRHGRVATNFTRIKAGSLLRANGGYLVFDLTDALGEPLVWKELKRTLKAGAVEIESYDPFSLFTVSALQPEPIPLSVRLVAAGPPLIYHLLALYDDDFSRIFRVKADFDVEIGRQRDAGRLYGQFVRKLSDEEGVLPFTADGVAALIHAGARLAGHRDKLSTEFTYVGDVVRESDFYARRAGALRVTDEHVRTANEQRVFRSNLVAEKIRELIANGTLLIELREPAVGHVNGLAVANLGDYAFGRPSRITASVGVGAAGIVNIERESRLSGQTYDKGLLILEGYLRNTYSQEQPLALSASIAMEQSYSGIDGDSASVAELLCLLSAIAGVPLRQDVAVTGSINQWGQVQAIGGVNEKVEGFFDVCSAAGLTGTQGVCLPQSNVKNLVLRPDVVDAIGQQRFHLWGVSHVDEAIELFTRLKPGDVKSAATFHGKVMERLAWMIKVLKDKPAPVANRVLWMPGERPEAPRDPRPPLPDEGDAGRGA